MEKKKYKFICGPEALLFVFGGTYQFLWYFYDTFNTHCLMLVSGPQTRISCMMVSVGFSPYCRLWHGNDPDECTVAFQTSEGMMYELGLDILVPQQIQISYYLQDMFLKFFCEWINSCFADII